jgi:hypothetical protein
MSIQNPEQYAPRVATVEYKVVGNTNASDPGNGCMRFNTDAQSDATQLYFAELSVGNIDVSSIFESIQTGDVLDFRGKNDISQTATFTVSAVTDNGTWYTADVTPGASSGFPVSGNTGVIITVQTGDTDVLPPGAQAYEYHGEVLVTTNEKTVLQRLNELGQGGWQLVQFYGLGSQGHPIAWFIRPV